MTVLINPPPINRRGLPINNSTKLEEFTLLTLPDFQSTKHNDDDPPYPNASSHLPFHLKPGSEARFFQAAPRAMTSPVDVMRPIKGAVIYSEGLIEARKLYRFMPFQVQAPEATFHTGMDFLYNIPTILGVPIWLRPHDYDPDITDRSNPAATWLHIIGDIDSSSFGLVTRTWIDSAVVMRVDGKDILAEQVEVLAYFCKFVVEWVLGGQGLGLMAGLSKERGKRERQMAMGRKLVCRAGYEWYERQYWKEKGIVGVLPLLGNGVDGGGGVDGEQPRGGAGTGEAASPGSGEEGLRRSGRVTRVPSWVLDDSAEDLGDGTVEGDEKRGRKRKFKKEEEE